MNPQQSIWVFRDGKANGPHPISKIVGAKKNGKLLPTDRLSTSPNGPWHQWAEFVAEIKASSPSREPQANQATPRQSQGVYRVQPDIILVSRTSAEFPHRCILSGSNTGLVKQPIHVQISDSCKLLTESEKKMTPGKWILWAIKFGIGQIPGVDKVTEVFEKGGDFWNLFGLGKVATVEVFVDAETFAKWTRRNRRASRWLLACIGIVLISAAIEALLFACNAPVFLQTSFFMIAIVGGVFGIPACIALRMVMGNRRLLEMNCFNDEWLWLWCREKAFVESLDPSPLPAPVFNWFFSKSELPNSR